MTDDDKTPVDTACGSPIRGRQGEDLGYCCNIMKGHLGRHACVYQWPGKEPVVLMDDGGPNAK